MALHCVLWWVIDSVGFLCFASSCNFALALLQYSLTARCLACLYLALNCLTSMPVVRKEMLHLRVNEHDSNLKQIL